MTMTEIENLLDETRLPYAYLSFNASGKKAVSPPYIVYIFTGTKNIKADNRVYYKADTYRLELYTNTKDTEVESNLEIILNLHNIPWEKDEGYINDQSMFQITYEIN